MKFSEARQGRVFVLRLEEGEVLNDVIEKFAEDMNIRAAGLIALGAADSGSRLVVGPADGKARPIEKMVHMLENVHEIAAVGTLFRNESGKASAHVHLAAGRKGNGSVGCAREGVRVWQIVEVILFELLDTSSIRVLDPSTGFELLDPR